ncbi:MAG: lamin tail domain-containing protein, partial [Chitinophagaceae bacterium]|nr:lamin tail domain-containing protein [Chitinophagaceae bacterium]
MKKVYKVFFGCMGLFLLMPFLGQAQAKIVISQVYGGGGNSNATFNYDYVELFNAGTTAQNLSGWSVQYASSTGSTWSVATLSGSIDPGKYYLIQLATGNVNVGAPLPAADATGTLNLSGTNGKVALVNNTNALSGTCPTTNVVDFVGFGSANCSEGNQPTGVLSNTAAAIRKTNGCTDTDNNGADFDVNTPNPRNSQTAANLCTSPTPPSGAGNANPSSLNTGESTLLTVTVSPGTNPASTGLSVTVNLSSIGGNAAQTMYDNGTNGDAVAGDNIFSYSLAVAAGSTTGTFSLPFSVTDGQSRSASGNIGLTILAGIANSNSGLVISQIYGNGSTTGAFRYDYVEIFNRSTETINLSGKSLQYASATGTGNFGANAITALTGNLAPGQYYLVRLAGAASGTDVPAQDASGTNNISAASGKLVIVNSTQGLACNGGSTPCTTEQLGQIIDLVGYGTANFFEG